MELMFLGTGAGRPLKGRNVTSVALMFGLSRSFWLFDCGEGTQHQLLRTPLKLSAISHVFVTHLHGDHLFGLPGLLSSRSSEGGTKPVRLFGPNGLREWIDTSIRISRNHLDYDLDITEIEEGVILETDRYLVTAARLEHRIECFGYRIAEKPKPGRLNAERLKEIGVPMGPLYGKLKRGEDVTWEDGRIIRAAEVLGPEKPGRIVAILGDTSPCEQAVKLSQHADIMVHEATFDATMTSKALDYGHSTTQQAAESARKAKAKRLIITHFSSRFGTEDLERLAEEAREVFPNTEAAVDLLHIRS
ncbi:ribonuclease Z [Paenibacillus tarimensis]